MALQDEIGLRLSADNRVWSSWLTVTQPLIDHFSKGTLDADPMHVDAAWAAEGPFGSTVLFGFQTMSLLMHFLHDALDMDYAREPKTRGYYLNYGFDRVRMIRPVPVNSKIRAGFRLVNREADSLGRYLTKIDSLVELEGVEQPALAAEWLSMWVPPSTTT